MPDRIVIALGGNALAPAGTAGTAAEQTALIGRTMKHVAELVDEGLEIVLTHGNGPQVGNVLIKNELASHVVPPVPLDWCVAQTQATIGFTAASALSHELRLRGLERPVVPIVSRVLVAEDDPAFGEPTKPIGRSFASRDELEGGAPDPSHTYRRFGERGWRRVVPSPRPLRSVDLPAITLLLDRGSVVIANGGGGIPVVESADGPLRGVEAVVDKDLAGAMLAEEVGADRFVVLTDVPGVAVGYGTDDERWLEEVTVDELGDFEEAGEFAAGSMAPKVEAARRFAGRTGGLAVIAALGQAVDAVHGAAGTRVRRAGA